MTNREMELSMTRIQTMIRIHLFELQDKKYKVFQCKLMPTVNPEKVIGVRVPQLRKYAKELSKIKGIEEFMEILPHKYYEEDNLHGFLIEHCKDYSQTIDYLEKFLPFIDNWSTCDIISPKIFKKHLDELIEKIKEWCASDKTFTIRFGIEMLMSFYLDSEFDPEYLSLVSKIKSEEYYVNMMIAWFFATALAKQYDSTVVYIEHKKLDPWIHNKTIQKAVESNRISDEKKAYLKQLKIKL